MSDSGLLCPALAFKTWHAALSVLAFFYKPKRVLPVGHAKVSKWCYFSCLFQLSPGEDVSLNIQGYDELNHTIFTIATLSETGISDTEPKLQLNNIMHLLSPVTKQSLPLAYQLANKTVYNEVKNKSVHHFQLEDIFSTLKNRYMFNVTAVPCKPGFKFEGTKCKCDKTIEGVQRWRLSSVCVFTNFESVFGFNLRIWANHAPTPPPTQH